MSWKANEKPRRRVRSSRPRTVALVARGDRPRGSALAPRHMQVPCQCSKSTNREKSTTRWSDLLQVRPGGGAIRPRGWSESPHSARPLGSPSGLACPGKRGRERMKAIQQPHVDGKRLGRPRGCGTRSTPEPKITSVPDFSTPQRPLHRHHISLANRSSMFCSSLHLCDFDFSLLFQLFLKIITSCIT